MAKMRQFNDHHYRVVGHCYFHVIDPLPGQDLPFFLGRAQVRAGYRNDRGHVPPGFAAVVVLLRGQGVASIPGGERMVSAPGAICFDTDRMQPGLRCTGDGVTMSFMARGAGIRAHLAALVARHGLWQAVDPEHPVLRRAVDMTEGSELLTLGAAQAHELVTDFLHLVWPDPAPSADRLQQAVLAAIAEPDALRSAARNLGLSREHLSRRLRRELGRPAVAWLAEERLRRAARLLSGGGLTVAAVASLVGYASATAFGAAFQRAHGMSPGAWARRGRR